MNEEKDNVNAAQEAAQGADAREVQGAAASAQLGKFRSVDALLNAYSCLEAEFTRRSQRLRELEGKLAKNESAAVADENGQPSAPRASSEVSENTAARKEEIPEEMKRAVISEYLAAVRSGAPLVMAGGGTHVSAPEKKARTLGEAALLAEELFKKER